MTEIYLDHFFLKTFLETHVAENTSMNILKSVTWKCDWHALDFTADIDVGCNTGISPCCSETVDSEYFSVLPCHSYLPLKAF